MWERRVWKASPASFSVDLVNLRVRRPKFCSKTCHQLAGDIE
jgi:hypothetical protein